MLQTVSSPAIIDMQEDRGKAKNLRPGGHHWPHDCWRRKSVAVDGKLLGRSDEQLGKRRESFWMPLSRCVGAMARVAVGIVYPSLVYFNGDAVIG